MSCKNWNVQGKANVSQENNSVERFLATVLMAYDAKYKKDIQLETCGPSSLEACLEGLGVDQSQAGILQPSDYYTMAMNDPKILGEAAGWPLPVNRYIKAYPMLVAKLYPKLECWIDWFREGVDPTPLIRSRLQTRQTVLIANLKQGHYVALLHVDQQGLVTYNESWMNNTFNPGKERKRTIRIEELVKNLKVGVVVIQEA
jgi:hypothetical protein